MSNRYEIHPRVGVARLGNSPDEFYLAPETVGGLPITCDSSGNAASDSDGLPQFVKKFKDNVGRVKRQAAKFRIFDTESNCEVTLSDSNIKKITWTVHIANKKPIWYTFSELQGNLEFGSENSYEAQHIPVNNPDVTDEEERQKLIIDPGPRSIDTPGDVVEFSRYNIPDDYSHGSFPPVGKGGAQIDSLGELRMDKDGHLVALGAYGKVTGSAKIESFRGAGGYWDDISDGFVIATLHFSDGQPSVDVDPGWLIVGSPKYAPELVNITTLYDTMYDVAVRNFDGFAEFYDKSKDTAQDFFSEINDSEVYTPLNGYDPTFKVSYRKHIKPIIDRIKSYRWVADIPYLTDFASPGFDMSDPVFNCDERYFYFQLFRIPILPQDYEEQKDLEDGPNHLFSKKWHLPLMPLNSGDNSVTNSGPIYKFETLSVTQYYFLTQWANGHFLNDDDDYEPEVTTQKSMQQLDEAGVGNCVGAPFSPGIETTWIVRNAPIYDKPLQFKLANFEGNYSQTAEHYRSEGLSTTADEANGLGCEPGDLTKRMAIPWQADFQECTVQTPNITNPSINQFADGTGIEVPPAYYVYWWPPQSPMHVMTGSVDPGDQVLDAIVSQIDGQPIIPAGQRVPYQRGINSVQDMIDSWSRLGFIVDQGRWDVTGKTHYPYFVETERDSKSLGQLVALREAKKIATAKAKA